MVEAPVVQELQTCSVELKCEIKPMDSVICHLETDKHTGPLNFVLDFYPRAEGDTHIMIGQTKDKFEQGVVVTFKNKKSFNLYPSQFHDQSVKFQQNYDKHRWYVRELFVKIVSESGCTFGLFSKFTKEANEIAKRKLASDQCAQFRSTLKFRKQIQEKIDNYPENTIGVRAAKAEFQALKKRIRDKTNQDKAVVAPDEIDFIKNHEDNVMCWPEYQLEHQSIFQHK